MTRGFIILLTGTPCSGKSTLGRGLKPLLEGARGVEVLDGDEVRATLSPDLGFSKADRLTNLRRIGYVARAIARTGGVAIISAIAPYQESRDALRAEAARDGVGYFEIYVHAPLEARIARDRAGRYERALAGQLPHFTGVGGDYEVPARPELALDTAALTVSDCLAAVGDLLRRAGVWGAP